MNKQKAEFKRKKAKKINTIRWINYVTKDTSEKNKEIIFKK